MRALPFTHRRVKMRFAAATTCGGVMSNGRKGDGWRRRMAVNL
jgi:hypothetical protein